MRANSSPVESSQVGMHPALTETLLKRQRCADQTPIAEHSRVAFDAVREWFYAHPKRILDLGCGTAESSFAIASSNPDAIVLGVDRSEVRLLKHHGALNPVGADLTPTHLQIIRADQYDVLRMLAEDQSTVAKTYLLYPNPSPKPEHLLRRWHAHPAWPLLLKLSQQIEMRTNWQTYAEEFAFALRFFGRDADITQLESINPITAFERKYQQSGHSLWRVTSAEARPYV
jgi:tRNA (guanine-N7-)-methyltransferase